MRNYLGFPDEDLARLNGMLGDAPCGLGMKNEYADPAH